MSLLYDARLRALDSSGNPLVGATLTIYTAGTTTPASVFSDAGLSVPLTNPTSGSDVSDAGGWFPQVFAAEATTVDILLKNSAGTTIQSYEDVVFLGADTGTFTRTLAGNTRFKLSDSGGVVLMAFGDASPDNVGGTAKLQGWNGTQGDLVTLDFAAVNTTGAVKENSKKLIGVVNTEKTDFTAVTSVDVALTQNPTGVLAWDVDFFGLTATSASTQFSVQFSYDGGGTFKSGASDYSYYYEFKNTAIPSDVSYVADDAHTQIVISTVVSAAAKRTWLRLRLLTVASGSEPTMLTHDYAGYDVGPNPAAASGHGYGLGGYGLATHIRLLASTGTMSGSYIVMPRRGYGEA